MVAAEVEAVVEFQSAPGGGAGGNSPPESRPPGRPRFNPPPAVGPGETLARLALPELELVSIRPRRWGRGKPRHQRDLIPAVRVSIRPRRWGRGKLALFYR